MKDSNQLNMPQSLDFEKLLSINHTIDLDALMGHFDFDVFAQGFKSAFNLSIINTMIPLTSHEKIKANLSLDLDHGPVLIKKLPHYKIGYANTCLGVIDIFIVSKTIDNHLSSELMRSLLFDIFNLMIDDKSLSLVSKQFLNLKIFESDHKSIQTISGNILSSDFNVLFDYIYTALINKSIDSILYLESFGNKSSTLTLIESWHVIESMIVDVFSNASHKNLIVDFCISSSAGPDLLTVPNIKFFDCLDISPNYFPLFSKSILNFNMSLVDKKTAQLSDLGKRYNSYKFNFYSTFKNIINIKNHNTLSSPISLSLMTHKLFDCWIHGNKNTSNTLIHKKSSVNLIYSQRTSKEYPYRSEFRCKLIHVRSLINKIAPVLISENFKSIPSHQFFSLLQYNLDHFISLIASGISDPPYTFDSLIKSLIAELILDHFFLAGSSTCPLLPHHSTTLINHLIPWSDNISIVDITSLVLSVFKSLSPTDNLNIIDHLITYTQKLSDPFKHIIKLISQVYYLSMHDQQIFDILFKAYIYSVTNDLSYDTSILTNHSSMPESSIKYSNWINDHIIQTTRAGRSNIARLILNVITFRRSYSDNSLKDAFTNYTKSIGLAIIPLKKGRAYYLAQLDYSPDTAPIRKELFDQFNTSKFTQALRASANNQELVRFVNAFFRYRDSNSRIESVVNDFAYGFYPARNIAWIKNRIQYLTSIVRSKNQFTEFISNVKTWSPEQFTIKDRIKYMKDLEITLTEDQMAVYEKLVEMDSETWNKHDFHTALAMADEYEVFSKVVQNATKYINILSMIKEWYAENVVQETIPPIEEFQQDPFEIQSIDLIPEHIQTELSLIEESNNIQESSNDIDLKTFIFSKVRYRSFNPSFIRKQWFKSKRRISVYKWKNLFENMLNEKSISLISNIHGKLIYKFNLKSSSGKYITYDHMKDFLKKHFNSIHFTKSISRKKFYICTRPLIDDWSAYIDDLVYDNIISIESSDNDFIVYKIIN